MTKVWIVRGYASDGSIVGGVLEDLFGKPLTAQAAHALAKRENERTAKRRAQNLPAPYTYAVDSFIR